MATPRVKRALAGQASDPAQRPITSFFARNDDGWSHSPSPSERTSRSPSYDTSSPLLPPNVQANLLAVGMRVRKSVPEGYKTGKEVDGRTTPFRYQPQPKAPSSSTLSYKQFLQGAGRPAAHVQSSCELVPFCGLNKTGGLGVQASGNDNGRPLFAPALFDGMADDAAADMEHMEPPSLTSSQETVSSMSSMSSYQSASRSSQAPGQAVYAAQKRLLDDDEDMHQTSWAVPASATTSINSWLAGGDTERRVLAVPRRRQQQSPSQSVAHTVPETLKPADGSVRVRDQENADDFDEADFLGDMEMNDM